MEVGRPRPLGEVDGIPYPHLPAVETQERIELSILAAYVPKTYVYSISTTNACASAVGYAPTKPMWREVYNLHA